MRYRNIIPVVMLFCALISQAQTLDEGFLTVRRSLGEMFQGLDRNKIPTDYLLDVGVDRVDLSDFNGEQLTDANLVTFPLYKEILKSISSCHVLTIAAITRTYTLETAFDEFVNEGEVGLSLALYKYNYILPNALDDNLICYNEATNQVSDVTINGEWQNPYAESVLFVSSPNMSELSSLNVTYVISPSYVWNNIPVERVDFDAGDGQGYRLLVANSPINVSYSEYGDKELKMRIRSQGSIYYAHSSIRIKERPESGSSSSLQSGFLPTPTHEDTVMCVYNGKEILAQYSSYYIPGNSTLTRPFIVAEGLDPWMLGRSADSVSNLGVHLGHVTHSEFNQSYWAQSALCSYYDLIYVDWDDSLVDIKANAELLRRIILKVNQEKISSGSAENNIVMGQSMGGLVARYALRKMELDGEKHETATYISHDSPHWGANVPLGAMFFIQQALSYAHGYEGLISLVDMFTNNLLSDAENTLCDVIHGESVKQMLVNYVNKEGRLDNDTHNEWLQELARIGFPQKTENVAIVNGAHFDKDLYLGLESCLFHFDGYVQTKLYTDILKGIFGTGVALLMWIAEDEAHAAALLGFSPSRVNILAEINPLSTRKMGSPISVLDVNYTKRFLWLFPKNYTIFSSEVDMPSVGLYYDDFPGSLYSFSQFGGPVAPINEQGCFSNNLIEYSYDLRMGSKMMFIPTASALAIKANGKLTSADYYRDYYNDRPLPVEDTPFDAYILAYDAQEHITISDSIASKLSVQLQTYIEGPDTLSSTANYTLAGFSGPVQWKSSDNSKAVIDNNGRLTAIGNGAVEISAESYADGQLIRKTKKVMIGYPDIAISYCFSPGSGHVFYVSAPDDFDIDALQELVDDGYLKYEWSILCDESDMTTDVSNKPTINYLPKYDESVTVCLRLVDNNGNKGKTYSRTVNLKNPFMTNYRYVEVNAFGAVTFVKANSYEQGMPSEDFAITFRNIVYTPNDDLYYLQSKYIEGNMCYLAYPNGNRTTYLSGIKSLGQLKWSYDLFNTPMFIDALEDFVNRAGSASITQGEIKDFNIFICNANKDTMQRIPFALIYK